MKQISLFIACMLISACAAANKNNPNSNYNQWIGKNISTLRAVWGKPNSVTTLANGNVRYSYTKRSVKSSLPPATTNEVIVAGKKTIGYSVGQSTPTTLSASCTVIFDLNKEGHVLQVKQQGTGC